MTHSGLSNPTKNVLLSQPNDRGTLIAFEGCDGCGKTTQRKLFKGWLRRYETVVVTKWNSSRLFKPIIKQRKLARSLDSASYAGLHAADFWHRYETIILPALRDGKVVLADRYVFTGLARDAARGVDRQWGRFLYAGARRPDLTFYFNAPILTCASRITSNREIRFYEAGQDVTGLPDAYQSYMRFAQSVTAEYKQLHNEFGFVNIDAELPIYEQHRIIRDTFLERFGLPAQEPVLEPQLSAFLSEVDV